MENAKEDRVEKILSSFSCAQDHDIESFLRQRATKFEKLYKSRTYLVVDQDQLLSDQPVELTIYGYFSLALKVLAAPENLSNRQRLSLDGFSSKMNNLPVSLFPCYLIGQLSRNSNVPKDAISGDELINLACSIIDNSVDAVGGRIILVECHPNQKLINFYKHNGFSEIARIPDDQKPMVQMIKRTCQR